MRGGRLLSLKTATAQFSELLENMPIGAQAVTLRPAAAVPCGAWRELTAYRHSPSSLRDRPSRIVIHYSVPWRCHSSTLRRTFAIYRTSRTFCPNDLLDPSRHHRFHHESRLCPARNGTRQWTPWRRVANALCCVFFPHRSSDNIELASSVRRNASSSSRNASRPESLVIMTPSEFDLELAIKRALAITPQDVTYAQKQVRNRNPAHRYTQ